MPAQERKDIMKIMGLNMTSTIAELMEFLMEPQDKGRGTKTTHFTLNSTHVTKVIIYLSVMYQIKIAFN